MGAVLRWKQNACGLHSAPVYRLRAAGGGEDWVRIENVVKLGGWLSRWE